MAWTSFAAQGIERVIVTGDRLRGDDPAVKAAPWGFVLDGTPEGEQPNVYAELEQHQLEREPPPDADVAVLAEPEEYRDLDIAKLRRDLRVAVGTTVAGGAGRVVTFKRGARFLADSELVRALPDAFETRGKG